MGRIVLDIPCLFAGDFLFPRSNEGGEVDNAVGPGKKVGLGGEKEGEGGGGVVVLREQKQICLSKHRCRQRGGRKKGRGESGGIPGTREDARLFCETCLFTSLNSARNAISQKKATRPPKFFFVENNCSASEGAIFFLLRHAFRFVSVRHQRPPKKSKCFAGREQIFFCLYIKREWN